MADSPPLLPAGFHKMTLDELKKLCVDGFSSSGTRAEIFGGLCKVIEILQNADIKGELWTDGSFLTEKVDPRDTDVLLVISGEEYDAMRGAKRDIIKWFNEGDLKTDHFCDSYVLFEFPVGHPRRTDYEWFNAYWIRQFGFSRESNTKGMALLTL